MNLHRRLAATWLVLAAACHQDAPVTTPVPPPAAVPVRAVVISGDAQQGEPDDLLAVPVRFELEDASGQPVAGATVTLTSPLGGGTVPASSKVSDASGIVETPWTMGSDGGVQTLDVQLNSTILGSAHATTCAPEQCFPPEELSASPAQARLLTFTTYDSSGQTVHPDVVKGHGAATGYWMAITPYPGGNSSFENPSIFHSKDGNKWEIPTSLVNPVAQPDVGGYLSDPDIVSTGDKQLWMYYRNVIHGNNVIQVVKSPDGIHWSNPSIVVTVPNHLLVSPSVVNGAPQAKWQMWSVNSGTIGCSAPQTTVERRTSTDGMTWGLPQATDLVQPGQVIWHVDVEWIPARAEYWAVYNTYPVGTTCTTDALYLARSSDGTHWTTYPSPIARVGVIDAFKHLIYRSTLIADPAATRVKLWISGATYVLNVGYVWQTATVSTSIDNLLALVSAPRSSVRTQDDRSMLPPPEPDIGH